MPLHVKVVDVLQSPGQDHVGQDLQLGSLYVGLTDSYKNFELQLVRKKSTECPPKNED